jgi:hypothetical protein
MNRSHHFRHIGRNEEKVFLNSFFIPIISNTERIHTITVKEKGRRGRRPLQSLGIFIPIVGDGALDVPDLIP